MQIYHGSHLFFDLIVSYEEFLEMFRKQTKVLVEEVQTRTPEGSVHNVDDVDHSLLGLDAKIPGGKFDCTIPAPDAKEIPPF